MASKTKPSDLKAVSSHNPTSPSSSRKRHRVKRASPPVADADVIEKERPSKRVHVPSRAAVESRESEATQNKASKRHRASTSRKPPLAASKKNLRSPASAKGTSQKGDVDKIPASTSKPAPAARHGRTSKKEVAATREEDVEDLGSLTSESGDDGDIVQSNKATGDVAEVEEEHGLTDNDDHTSGGSDEEDSTDDVDDADFIEDEEDISAWSTSEDIGGDGGELDEEPAIPGSDDEKFKGDSLFEELTTQDVAEVAAIKEHQPKAKVKKISNAAKAAKARREAKKLTTVSSTPPPPAVSKTESVLMAPPVTPISKAAAAAKARRARMGASTPSSNAQGDINNISTSPFEVLKITSVPEIHGASIQSMIQLGSFASRWAIPTPSRPGASSNEEDAIYETVYAGLQSCRDVLQVFNALEFMNDGIFINPSHANPSLVRAVPTTKANGNIPSEFDRKLVLANGPVATTGNAVFVSTIFVKDVKLKESVEVKGMPTHLHRRLASGMFEVETELKTGFLGDAFPKFPSIIISRDQECTLFTMRHKDKKSAQHKSLTSLSPGD
ncbi:hypothetical protein BDN71DRAFT_1594061 [Pleurotus eryngii]|uniref:Uncharacterized protein n=1 Tax=Pleurotus eryngii TaxID=5323 RepID=A0A9P6DA18_PLEER|nr:hypothetical protein BDN71DRAFT_1594061 [Pleurotus eryngii]